MADITITQDPAAYVITAGGVILGRTARALRLVEDSYPVKLYVPRADIDMARLVRTDRLTTCPRKGVCSYYSIQTGTGLLENAAWSYDTPITAMEALAGHLAFYPDRTQITPV